jgi:stage III sporulation protein AE
VLAASTEVCVHVIEKILVPIVMLSFAVCIVSCMSEKINADKFSAFLMKTVKWVLTVMLIIFIGVVGLQSIATSSVDGLSVKLTKFATSNLVPVVGGILSESVETLMNCSIVIKNSVGVCGILAVLYMSLMPVIKLWVNLIVLRFSAAVMQPISDVRIIKCITNTADLVSLLLAILASTSVMFILIITIIINTGNSVIMLGR